MNKNEAPLYAAHVIVAEPGTQRFDILDIWFKFSEISTTQTLRRSSIVIRYDCAVTIATD